MAQKKRNIKKGVKTGAKVAVAGYAWRLSVTGGAAKRKAQSNAVRSDAKKVGRVAKKAAIKAGNTRAGRAAGNTRTAVGAAMAGERAVRKTKKVAGAGPGDLVRSAKRGVKRVSGQAKKGYSSGTRGAPHLRGIKSDHVGNKVGKAVGGYRDGKANRYYGSRGDSRTYRGGHQVGRKVYAAGATKTRAQAGYASGRAGGGFADSTFMAKRHEYKAGRAVGVAAKHVSAHKTAYGLAAAGVAAGGAAGWAYRRRKASQPGNKVGSTTYKRRYASGKVGNVTRMRGGKR